jgi:hypothetical protein
MSHDQEPDPDKDHSLLFSFGIDNGELDDVPRNQIFTLGFELGEIHHYLEHGDRMSRYERNVRIENKDRIARLVTSFHRTFSLAYQAADRSESWVWLVIEPVAR